MTVSTVYRIKLTDFELRVLIGVLAEYRQKLIAAWKDMKSLHMSRCADASAQLFGYQCLSIVSLAEQLSDLHEPNIE